MGKSKSWKKRQSDAPKPVPLITVYNSRSEISEQYRMLRSNIRFSSVDGEPQTLLVTSSGSGEGKSTTTANLAVVFADAGIKTLLVDADLRRPTVNLTFRLNNDRGLSSLLSDRRIKTRDVIRQNILTNLDVLPSGPESSKPADLLASDRMAKLLKELKKTYELIIFDTPPLLAVTDAQLLAPQVDGTLLVVREGKTRKQRMMRVKELLRLSEAKVLGVVYNATHDLNKENYYGYR